MQALTEISQRARKVLIKEFGVSDAIRFLSRFQVGSGDYIRERERRFKHVPVRGVSLRPSKCSVPVSCSLLLP